MSRRVFRGNPPAVHYGVGKVWTTGPLHGYQPYVVGRTQTASGDRTFLNLKLVSAFPIYHGANHWISFNLGGDNGRGDVVFDGNWKRLAHLESFGPWYYKGVQDPEGVYAKAAHQINQFCRAYLADVGKAKAKLPPLRVAGSKRSLRESFKDLL